MKVTLKEFPADLHSRLKALTEVANSRLKLAYLLMERISYDLPAQRIFSTARETTLADYDSQYVCLAQDLGLNLHNYEARYHRTAPKSLVVPETIWSPI